MISNSPTRISLIGCGTVGLSLVALHIETSKPTKPIQLTVFDPRPDVEGVLRRLLPLYLQNLNTEPNSNIKHPNTAQEFVEECLSNGTIRFANDLKRAVADADIVEEQGPESLEFKKSIWPKVELYCSPKCLLWTSTSGIPASAQSVNMKDPSRLIVVHPFNPPHIMPLLEIVPSPNTSQDVISRTTTYWEDLGRHPIHVKKEVPGFVANRLAFALFREAIDLVRRGVATPRDVDLVVTESVGPRWAIAGPFESYHAGGGEGGLTAFFDKLGGTIQNCWDSCGVVNFGEGWETELCKNTEKIYGVADLGRRDELTRKVLRAVHGTPKL